MSPTPKPVPNLAILVERYLAGESIKALANEIGIYDARLGRRFHELGIDIRKRNTYPANTEAAHLARRGQHDPSERKEQRARTRQVRISSSSHLEDGFDTVFQRHGVVFVRQYAIDMYNVDFALPALPLAVEIRGGGYSDWGKARIAERLSYIQNSGWHTIQVFITDCSRRTPDIWSGAAAFIAAYIRRCPSVPEHHEIRADGQPRRHNNRPFSPVIP